MSVKLQKTLLLVFTVLILAILNYAIVQKEHIIRHGDTLLLELAPVDPRSLIQGDYMRLRYKIADQARKHSAAASERGYLVVRPDADGVGRFVRFYHNEPLQEDERLVRYHKPNYRIRIVPDSFLFQEGHAEAYSRARYGIFKTTGRKGHVLTGLADAEWVRIEPE